jgi:hypothetical protein
MEVGEMVLSQEGTDNKERTVEWNSKKLPLFRHQWTLWMVIQEHRWEKDVRSCPGQQEH